MANRSRMSMLKRQREMKKNEKAARKRAKRHGAPEAAQIPTATVSLADLLARKSSDEDDSDQS